MTFPVKAPSKVPATNVSLPTVHLSSVSFHNNVLLDESPRSTSIPAFSVGVEAAFELRIIMLSSTVNVSVLIIV